MSDPYAVLGVPPGATADQIRAAYRNLAARLHPDRNPGDERVAARFRQVSEAYARISSGTPPREAGGAAPRAQGVVDLGDVVAGFVDILFGNPPARRPSSFVAQVRLDRAQAAAGVRREVLVPWDAPCAACAGQGGLREGPCGDCGGTGRTGANLGLVRIFASCPGCSGSGRATRPCRECGGVGYAPRREPVQVDIPAGVRDGARLRYGALSLRDAHGRPLELVLDVRVEF